MVFARLKSIRGRGKGRAGPRTWQAARPSVKAVLEPGSARTQKLRLSLENRDAARIPDPGQAISSPTGSARGLRSAEPQGSRWGRSGASGHRHSSPAPSRGMPRSLQPRSRGCVTDRGEPSEEQPRQSALPAWRSGQLRTHPRQPCRVCSSSATPPSRLSRLSGQPGGGGRAGGIPVRADGAITHKPRPRSLFSNPCLQTHPGDPSPRAPEHSGCRAAPSNTIFAVYWTRAPILGKGKDYSLAPFQSRSSEGVNSSLAGPEQRSQPRSTLQAPFLLCSLSLEVLLFNFLWPRSNIGGSPRDGVALTPWTGLVDGTRRVKSISTQGRYLHGEGCSATNYPNTSSHNQR